MRVKAALQNKVTKRLFSPERRDASRRKAERARQASARPHVVEYFHDVCDPYSHLMVQILPSFLAKYDVELRTHVTPPPPDWAAPDRGRLDAYARKDAALLAGRMRLEYTDPGQQPTEQAILAAQTELCAVSDSNMFLEKAVAIGAQVWRLSEDLEVSASEHDVAQRLAAAAARRDDLGHYLGGTLFYEGEWYWGPDRLHYLESRLQELDAFRDEKSSEVIFSPPPAPVGKAAKPIEPRPVLHWYLSFRSPYTGIVRDRIQQLAEAYGAELRLRYVLPMVMRGMSVPRKKGFYIMADTVREAERLDVSFGNAMDPVGKPVERGYAILHEAIKSGHGYAFAHSFLSGVWAEGIDAGSDRGLRTITERAGLAWDEMKTFIGSDDWRPEAEANQQEMFSYGIWGVPSFRVGEVATWGQDRLWLIEDELAKITGEKGGQSGGN